MSDPQQARILVIDDEAVHLQALCETLKYHGYACVGFTSASAALSVLPNQRFDLLLTDLVMPEMDGITLLQTALRIDPDLVGVIMTGQGTIPTAVDAMKTGALDYVLKPLKMSIVTPVLARALAVRRLRLENANLQRAVRERTMALEISNRELDAFCHSVSHDLRSPLRAVAGYAHMLTEDFGENLDPEARDLVDRISAGAKRMGLLIDDLLRLSQIGRQPLASKRIDVRPLFEEVIEEQRNAWPGREVRVDIGDLPTCVGDQALLRQVFVNLISNAFKYTKARRATVIEIEGHSLPGEQIYSVQDNGAGFDQRYAEELFGVFKRLHRADEFEGNGVGLSIAQRIVDLHGGRIWAEGQVDKGAKFYLSLPEDSRTVEPAPSRGTAVL